MASPRCSLTEDVLEWLARCSSSLKPGGLIVVKENLSTVSRYEIDQDDASVARSDDYLRELFKKAELKLLYSAVQKGAGQEKFHASQMLQSGASASVPQLSTAG